MIVLPFPLLFSGRLFKEVVLSVPEILDQVSFILDMLDLTGFIAAALLMLVTAMVLKLVF